MSRAHPTSVHPTRRVVAGAAIALGLAAAALLPSAWSSAAPPTTDPPTAADYGARWLASQVTPDGYVEGPGGDPSPAATLAVALGLASAGVEGGVFADSMDWMEANVTDVIQTGGVDDPGRIGQLLLLVDAAGATPTNFGGINLVTRVEATIGDFAPGLYGAGDPTYDGAYRQSVALMGLVSAGATYPNEALNWLLDQQCDTGPASAIGAWMAYRADTSVPCPAPDPDTFSGPDTNQTALAVQALEAWEVNVANDPAGFFEDAQTADGGFAYYPGQDSDPNSTALVIQALVALGSNPQTEWDVAGGDPLTSLLSWQLGCDADAADRGAFASPFSDGFPDLLATEQAVPAAALRTFPLGEVTFVVGPVPCEVPASTTTVTGGPSTTVAPSSSTSTSASSTTVATRAATATPTFTG